MSVNWFRFNCRRAVKLARMGTIGCLSDSERNWLTRHAGECSECRYYIAEVNEIRELVRAWVTVTPKSSVSPQLKDQWRKAIEEAARPPAKVLTSAADSAMGEPTWLGLDRFVPVSLVLIWLLAVGFHLKTPPIDPAPSSAVAPSLWEIRVVMEWLVKSQEAA